MKKLTKLLTYSELKKKKNKIAAKNIFKVKKGGSIITISEKVIFIKKYYYQTLQTRKFIPVT